MMRMRATTSCPACRAGATCWRSTTAGGGPRPPTPRPGPRCGPAPRACARKAIGVLSDFRLMEVADPGSAWVGRSLAEIAEARGTDVIDVLIDVVLVEKLTLFMVLPSLTPSLGRSDEGWRVRASVWKDPRVMLGGSDAGAHVDLMCHANYPTVVLGEVVRDRGLLVARGGGRDDDRPPGAPLRAAPPGPDRRGVARRPGGLRPRRGAPAGPPRSSTTCPAAASGSRPASRGVEHVFVGGSEVVDRRRGHRGAAGTVLRSGRDTDTVSLADVRR